ncbi:hypothetical protein D4A92_07655 [Rhizobium rosettiformans]|uniref:Uncharacterized protein n=1 Tax=Rhizobium rosettiformans TaxID=1368430 RepID=A0ABX7EVA0_9HYPH|nr:hypothetical protein [Rhizobium rosettiformans]QRF51317.1 hypothetical protein D4A92_07655 [Rhizobium rosettiformans]
MIDMVGLSGSRGMEFQTNPPDPSCSNGAAGYCNELVRAGWSEVGKGACSRVFHRAGDTTVIKVSDGDQCYLAFVDYVITNPMDCLPNLENVYRSQAWAVTHIEHLDVLSESNGTQLLKWWESFIAARRNNMQVPLPADWSQVACALQPIASEGGCGFDVKKINAMQRGSTVVFTDPLY